MEIRHAVRELAEFAADAPDGVGDLLLLGGRDAENDTLQGGWGSRNLAGISSRDILARRSSPKASAAAAAHSSPLGIPEEREEEEEGSPERSNWWQAGDSSSRDSSSSSSDKENATSAALAARAERPIKAAKLLLGREALSSRRCYPYP